MRHSLSRVRVRPDCYCAVESPARPETEGTKKGPWTKDLDLAWLAMAIDLARILNLASSRRELDGHRSINEIKYHDARPHHSHGQRFTPLNRLLLKALVPLGITQVLDYKGQNGHPDLRDLAARTTSSSG